MVSAHPTFHFGDAFRGRAKGLRGIDSPELHCAYNARAALYQFLISLSPDKGKKVLLPAFHCTTVVEPVVHAGFEPIFYRVNRNCSIDANDLAAKMSAEVSAVLVINYFGFPSKLDWVGDLRRSFDFCLIEDCAHSFLAGSNDSSRLSGGRGDISLYSFYKIAPSFAGGGLRVDSGFASFQPQSRSAGIKQSAIVLKRVLEQAIDNLDGGFLKSIFQSLERWRISRKKKSIPDFEGRAGLGDKPRSFRKDLAASGMLWMSRTILDRSDFSEIVNIRRRNYCVFNDHLREHSGLTKVFAALPADVCPWAFPVILRDRSSIDFLLRESGVPLFTFGEVLHELVNQCDGSTLEEARYLSDNLLLFSIHQDFEAQDVATFAHKVNAFFESKGERPAIRCSEETAPMVPRSVSK